MATRMDKQTRDNKVNEYRRIYQHWTDDRIAHELRQIAYTPRRLTAIEKEALLMTAANRLDSESAAIDHALGRDKPVKCLCGYEAKSMKDLDEHIVVMRDNDHHGEGR